MRIVFAPAALMLLATFAPTSLYAPPKLPDRPRVVFERVTIDPKHPHRRRLGPLTFLGGWALTSNDPRFGGISAMHVDGGTVVAMTDSGLRLQFSLREAGAAPLSIGPLPQGPGSPEIKRHRDSEAMVVYGPHLWISFERNNSIWRYRRSNWTSDGVARPAAMARWGRNRGGEAMVRLADGRFLVLAEGSGGAVTEAVLFSGDPAVTGTRASRLDYRPPRDYRPTDAAPLPDGRMLLLNRRASYLDGFSAKLLVAPAPAVGRTIEGREIAHLAPPLTVDNMEALSVARERGRTVVWMASDDNFLAFQRTLLLKFALPD